MLLKYISQQLVDSRKHPARGFGVSQEQLSAQGLEASQMQDC